MQTSHFLVKTAFFILMHRVIEGKNYTLMNAPIHCEANKPNPISVAPFLPEL